MGLIIRSVLIGVLTWGVLASVAHADEYDEFAIAKNAFDAGEYQESVKRFETLITQGMQNPSLIIEAHKFLAISYLFVGNETSAEAEFKKLLTRAPEFQLDPLLYPIEVVDFFTKIKLKSKRQLEALAKAREIEAKKQKAREAARQKAEAERLRRNIYLEREVRQGSLLVALLPLGAGQFQNKKVVKGALFLSGELILGGAAATFYFLHASLRDDASVPVSSERLQVLTKREKYYRLANFGCLGALGVVVGAGIIDSLLQFESRKVVWKKVKESDVPNEMRYKPKNKPLKLSIRPGISGISLLGSF